MKRSAIALGASVLALALTAGPAAADPGVGQTVGNSTGTAQVGAVAVDAPVRVASDGDSSATGASAGAPQTTEDSTGAAQVTSVDVDAPVRVLSDGDDAESAAPDSTAGTQSTNDSTGSAQVGATDVHAPARVASDGDNTAEGDRTSGPQSVDDSTGTAQVASPVVFAPVRVLSGGQSPDEEPGLDDDVEDVIDDVVGELVDSPSDDGGGEVVSHGSTATETSPATSDAPRRLRGLVDGRSGLSTQPAIELVSGGVSGDAVTVADIQAAGLEGDSLPLTGLGFVALVALGLWMLTSGAALRLVPGGTRR